MSLIREVSKWLQCDLIILLFRLSKHVHLLISPVLDISGSLLQLFNLHLSSIAHFDDPIWHAMLLKPLSPLSSYLIVNSCLLLFILVDELLHVTVNLFLNRIESCHLIAHMVLLALWRIETISVVLVFCVVLEILGTIPSHIYWCLVFSNNLELFICLGRVDNVIEVLWFDIAFVFFNVSPIVGVVHRVEIILLGKFGIHFSLLRILVSRCLNCVWRAKPKLPTVQTWMSEATSKCN